jgi:N4-(beta-N-acetylglucosaminyl)-L-asparaginase
MKVIASHNGLQATSVAWQTLQNGGSPLDACVDGVTVVENDPDELTVGYGGLPNEQGVVELDAAVMDGATHRGGAVAGLQGIRNPAKVARLVMEMTNRVLLVGQGALDFARANGFETENLLTERARRMWMYWKRTRSERDDWQPPVGESKDHDIREWFEKYFYGHAGPEGSPVFNTGTVHCSAIDAHGNMACVTSTSGHAFKIPGRVGDSPILGAGLYVDNEVGTCGSIGYGEANLENLSSFAVVELMRAGLSPVDAGLEVLRRVANRAHPYDCDDQGKPRFNLQLFILAKDGSHTGVSLRPGKRIAITDGEGTRHEDCIPLFPER